MSHDATHSVSSPRTPRYNEHITITNYTLGSRGVRYTKGALNAYN
jgi:hypothetical protein